MQTLLFIVSNLLQDAFASFYSRVRLRNGVEVPVLVVDGPRAAAAVGSLYGSLVVLRVLLIFAV